MNNNKMVQVVIVVIIAAILLFAFSSSIFYTVESGERAVLFKKFAGGLDKENIIPPGFGMKAPWNNLHVYEVRERSVEEKMDVLDKNGLSISVDVSVRFNPIFNQIGHLHENFGVNYVNSLVVPEVRSAVRQVMGRYTSEEIYSTKRGEVEADIKTETDKSLRANFIQMRAMLIRSIILPDQIKTAIENKLKEEQEALAYRFKLDKEQSEAERMRIQAEGEAKANAIINSSLTKELLKMRGIEATLKLAESPNAKIIVVGGGEDGLPLILGNN